MKKEKDVIYLYYLQWAQFLCFCLCYYSLQPIQILTTKPKFQGKQLNHLSMKTIHIIFMSTEAMLQYFQHPVSSAAPQKNNPLRLLPGKKSSIQKIKIIYLYGYMSNHIMNKYFRSSTVRRLWQPPVPSSPKADATIFRFFCCKKRVQIF